MAAQQFEYKIILLGEAGVGKTSLFTRIKTGRFSATQATVGTPGTDVYAYQTNIGDDPLNVTLWDTAGGERFRTLTNNFYRNADGVLLVFSVEDAYTFDNLQGWIIDASQYVKLDTCEWALLGNKCDLRSEIEKSRIEKFCEQLPNKSFYATSARSGENVMRAFKSLISSIHSKRHVKSWSLKSQEQKNAKIDSAISTEANITTRLSTDDKQKRRDSCCS